MPGARAAALERLSDEGLADADAMTDAILLVRLRERLATAAVEVRP